MSVATWPSMPDFQQAKKFLTKIVYDQEVNYERFETKIDGSDIVTFRENDPAFRLFGTKVHVKVGAYIACSIGLLVTALFCIFYTFFHSRGQGRNQFIDHLEIVDLVFAFVVGIPCHFLLFYGLLKCRKALFSPFLIFYTTNFLLNCIFTILTLFAFSMDVHRKIFGNIRFDLSWTAFQILFTCAQGFAIYVVYRGRKYVAAKQYWQEKACETGKTVTQGDTLQV